MEKDKRWTRAESIFRNAAIKLLEENEYSRITVKDIVDKAGYSKTTFYAHYKNCEECYKNIIIQEVNHHIQLFIEFIKIDQKNDAEIKRMFLTYFRYIKENKTFYRAILMDYSELFLFFNYNIKQKTKENFYFHMDDHQKEIFVGIRIEGLLAAVEYWNMHDFSISPEEITELYLNAYKITSKEINISKG